MPPKRRRGGILLGALALGIVVAAAVGASRAGEPPAGKGTKNVRIEEGSAKTRVAGVATTGSVAPEFDLRALSGGGRISLAAYRNQPVIVNFWASWCVSCRAEFPALRALTRTHRDVVVIGIACQDLLADSRRFARANGATWPLARCGPDDATARAYGVRAIPQTFFIDRTGVIRARTFGRPSAAVIDVGIARIRSRSSDQPAP